MHLITFLTTLEVNGCLFGIYTGSRSGLAIYQLNADIFADSSGSNSPNSERRRVW